MIKKKLLAVAIGLAISTGSAVPAFALDSTTQNLGSTQTKIEAKLSELKEKATKLGIDITGLTNDQVAAKIKETVKAKETAELKAKATSLGIDVTGLTNDQITSKIKEAVKAKEQKKALDLKKKVSTILKNVKPAK